MKDSRTIYHQIACAVIALVYLLLWAFVPWFKDKLGDHVLYAAITAVFVCGILSVFWEQGRHWFFNIRPNWPDVKYGTIAGIYTTGAFLVVYGIVYLIKLI